MPKEDPYKLMLAKPYRVSHPNGDVLQGFDDLASAESDAAERNRRAKELCLKVRYTAGEKPA